MKSTNRDLTWDAINGIAILLTMLVLVAAFCLIS